MLSTSKAFQSIIAMLSMSTVCTIISPGSATQPPTEHPPISRSAADLGLPLNIVSCAIIQTPIPTFCKAQGSDMEPSIPVPPTVPFESRRFEDLQLQPSDSIKIQILDFKF